MGLNFLAAAQSWLQKGLRFRSQGFGFWVWACLNTQRTLLRRQDKPDTPATLPYGGDLQAAMRAQERMPPQFRIQGSRARSLPRSLIQ